MSEAQRQQAGDQSQQIQVFGNYNYMAGVTEERAAAIARDQAMAVVEEFSVEAQRVAMERISKFDQDLIAELSDKQLLQSFSDPSFQLVLRKAQLQAAAVDNNFGHETLTKLIVERAADQSNAVHLAVTRAVEVVEMLDPQVLRGLSLFWFMHDTLTTSFGIMEGLEHLNNTIGLILEGDEYPNVVEWQSSADLLGCVQLYDPAASQFKEWRDLLPLRYPGYFAAGMAESSETLEDLRARLAAISPQLLQLISRHPLLDGCYRLLGAQVTPTIKRIGEVFPLTDEQRQELTEIYKLYFEEKSGEAGDVIQGHIRDNLSYLEQFGRWWKSLRCCETTIVGRALAYANVVRFGDLTGLGEFAEAISRKRDAW